MGRIKSIKIGLIVNPVAGMGGVVRLRPRAGKKEETYFEAIDLGREAVTPGKASEFLSHIKNVKNLFIYTAPREMGENIVKKFNINYSIVGSLKNNGTTAEDTKRIAKEMLEKEVDLIVYFGGDGTSRDIYDSVGLRKPVIGVPSGVKMYSSVLTANPRAAAETLDEFIDRKARITEGDVLDTYEEDFTKGILEVKHYGYLKIPQLARLSPKEESSEENKMAIAKYVVQRMTKDTLYLIGPGTTTKAITDKIKIKKNLMSVGAILNGKLIGEDLKEENIVNLINSFRDVKIIISPIGGQGFIFGRGNQEFSPNVIKSVGKDNIIVVATKDKMSKLSFFRVDTGDIELDKNLEGYVSVVFGHGEEREHALVAWVGLPSRMCF